MNQKAFFCLFSALAIPIIVQAAEQDIIERNFDVKAGGSLYMKVDRGTIKVLTSGRDKVEVEVLRELRRGSAEEGREIFEEHQIEFTQEGDTIRIEADNNRGGLLGFRNPFNTLQVTYTVTIPARFDLDLRTAGGNIDVADLDGQVKAQTSGGSLNIGSITGPINARTSGGNIRIQASESDMDVHTSGGSVSISKVKGNLKAKTSGGNINLGEVGGAVDAQTSGGSIKVAAAHGAIQAKTSGGNITADIADQPSGNCSLRTSGGSIKVTLAQTVAIDLDARTSGGRVRSDFPGEFNKQRTRLAARVNGGGPSFVLETSGGNVDVQKK